MANGALALLGAGPADGQACVDCCDPKPRATDAGRMLLSDGCDFCFGTALGEN